MRRTRRNRGGSALVGSPYIQSDPSSWGNANYYPYNQTPRFFTDYVYNDQQYILGGRRKRKRSRKRKRGGNSLYVTSQPVTNWWRAGNYAGEVTADDFRGHERGVDPSILVQPIGKK